MTVKKKITLPIVSFSSAAEWRKWLAKNHAQPEGVWLRLYKKIPDEKFLTYAEALDVALCYGWIDGQKNSYDKVSWIQKFTQRRPKSGWSKRNTEHVERLIQEKLMRRPGLLEIEAAKKDGRWQAAYKPPSEAVIPDDFMKELRKNKDALKFFQSLNKSNVYAIIYRLDTAKKPETRVKRMKIILEMMEKGQKLH